MARTKPSYQYIWKFKSPPTLSNSHEAPELIGFNTGSKSSMQLMGVGGGSNVGEPIDPDIKDYNYVNVTKEFTWTLNSERTETPRVILKEMEFATSSMMQQATYQLTQFAAPLAGLLPHDPLSMYDDLYVTYDSGFIYDLPYFADDALATGGNQWNRGGKEGESLFKMGEGLLTATGNSKAAKAGKILGGVSEAAGALGGIREFIGGGAGFFVEQPKTYAHGNNTKSYNVTFPLFNTGEVDDMIRNFQLAFMLVYQNNPNRQDKQLIRPPAIYELTIPGVAYSPYVQMKSVAVKFMGARRELTLDIPFEGGDEVVPVQCTIPEAYLVQLSMEEMVGTTRNFMYKNLKRKVSVGSK